VVDELVPPFFIVGKEDPKFGEAFISEFHDLGAQTGRGLLPGRGLVILHQGSERNPVVFALSTSYTFIVLLLLLSGTFIVVRLLTRSRSVARQPAWDGGLRLLHPEMTYTATGFSNPVRVIFDAIFRPSTVEDTKETVAKHFRTAIKSGREEVHIVDRSVFRPLAVVTRSMALFFGRMHAGSVNVYAAYILVTMVLLLLIKRFL
jgi:hydrogenase-4 component B